MLRLGFHYHIPMFQADDGQLRTPGYIGRFLDSLAAQVDILVCFLHSPREDELPQMDYTLIAPNLEFVNIGVHSSLPQRILNTKQITYHLHQHLERLDILLIRGPSPLLPAMAKAAGDLPIALLLVGDYLAGINDLPQPRWRKEAIRVWSWWNYRQQLRVAKRSLTFVNSHQLYQQLQGKVTDLVETRTTTLSQSDFFEREDTCQREPYNLLYTGRMDRAKGLFEMVEAVDWLTSNGYDVILDLVGWPQKGDQIVEELLEDASRRGIIDRVMYHGFKSVGEELFSFYKNSDIYLIASRSSEGFPRTIWEAMAHSLPVIASRVGSIPHYLDDTNDAILIAPRQASEIADAVVKIINDPDLRQHLIANAVRKAKANTLERRSKELISEIKIWLGK